MDHQREYPLGRSRVIYPLGRYRVIELIEKVKGGYKWRVTAHDDEMARILSEMAREVSTEPAQAVRFDAGRLAPTLDHARRELDLAAKMMRDDIAREPPTPNRTTIMTSRPSQSG
jgi:hypothetical protein